VRADILAAETGTIRKKWKGRLPVALLYPNIYPVAVSNLGFQQVYGLLNARDDIVCERVVYPARDEPLRSLESNRPLADFPILCVSISFEHDFPRLAAMLAAGGIEPYARQRAGQRIGPGAPLIIMGGVAVFMNPEPIAPFADIMAIGEAEPLLAPLFELLSPELASLPDRERLLRQYSALQGCYVPSLYVFDYREDGRVASIIPAPGVPARVERVYLGETGVAGHSRLLTPEAELSMYMVELGRGCSRGCRFCAAGFIYRPPRLWPAEAIVRALEERPPQARRIGLLGMEMAGSDTLEEFSRLLHRENLALSFSSLRADRITPGLVSLLADSGLKSVAIAPDGASERLRRVINKGLSEEDLLAAASQLARAGILHLKLYVMIGLPTETTADLDELGDMLVRLRQTILPIARKQKKIMEMTLSVNSFVPKPWTPFQYCSYGGLSRDEALASDGAGPALVALKQKIRYLRRMVKNIPNTRLRVDRPERVLEQAVFSRGDRRLAPVLLDMGTGRRTFRQAMRAHGLSRWQYAIRPRQLDELFCWQVLDHGVAEGYLAHELERAFTEKKTESCQPALCKRCGVCR